MNKTIDQNICFRIDRDGDQINRCKKFIQETNLPITDTAQILALAGNEVRLKILLLLQEEQKLCVCDLSEILEMKIPAVSQHLRKMKDAKMVLTERDGTVIHYSLSPKTTTVLGPIFRSIHEGILV